MSDDWRGKLERALGRALAKVQSSQLNKVVSAMLGNADLQVPHSVWQGVTAQTQGVLRPVLQTAYLDASKELMDRVNIGVDWTLQNERAGAWASQHTAQVVRGIVDNTGRVVSKQGRQLLAEQIAVGARGGVTRPQLIAALAPTFGPVRAAMIAATEVTRASAEGEAAYVASLEDHGVALQAIWTTANDELVCPICGALNEQARADDGMWHVDDAKGTPLSYRLPPAHPNCRCSVSYEAVV